MSKKIITLLALLFLTVSSTIAMDGIVGKVSASTDYTFTNKWYKTLGQSIPYLTEAKNLFRNQHFYIYPVMAGYTLDADSIARVKYDVKILAPDSSVYFEKNDVDALEAKIANPNFVMLADALLEVNFEQTDPLGTYQIEVVLKDYNAKSAGTVSTSVDLVEFKRVGGFTSDSIFNEWMQNYYKTLNAEAALDGCLYVAAQENKESYVDLTLSFFKELFEHNRYLIPMLEDEFFKQPDESNAYIGALLAILDYDLRNFKTRLDPVQVKWFENLQSRKSYFNITEVTKPAQLDMLWAQFFAGGSNEPIAKIVNALSLKKYDVPDRDSLTHLSEKEQQLYGTFSATVWSLRSNAINHELVYNYLNYIYEYENIPELIKSQLKEILNK